MEYEDSSGTDDDLPPSHQSRVQRGPHVGGNGRAVVGSNQYPMSHTDMESQIYHLEQEAYRSVLLAFKAQSDTTITWEKTSLMAELRKELNISEDEHKALLSRVDADDNLRKIREWRQLGGRQSSQTAHDSLPSPTFPASRKKQKITHSVPPALSLHPSSVLHPQGLVSPMRRGTLPGSKGKKNKSNQGLVSVPSLKSIQYPSRAPSGTLPATDPAESAGAFDPSLIGRKVRTRWPADNSFYEAVITEYKEPGLYSLLYDSNTPNATIEWVNLSEISPNDIRWEGEDPGIFRRGSKKVVPGDSRGTPKPLQNGSHKKGSDDIELLRTDTLIKEVELIFGASQPDPLEIQKAKKALKEHEQALVNAIARLAEAYDGKTDAVEKHLGSNGTQRTAEFEVEMDEEGRGVDGSDGD
ncbi:hypothetical protein ACHQM5_012294 [Ranunculus cassubicifolius]